MATRQRNETFLDRPGLVNSLTWTSIGEPAPQGSKNLFRGYLVESNKRLPAWRETLVNDIMKAAEGRTFTNGIIIQLVFRFPRIKAHYNSKGTLKQKAPVYKTTKPDLDKLCRAVLDSVTLAGVIRDDALCHTIEAQKLYCNDGDHPGVTGTIIDLGL